MKQLERKHPLAIRWFHWINFPLLALMIWSGAMIYWANATNHLFVIKLNPPQSLWQKLHMAYRLADAMYDFVADSDPRLLVGPPKIFSQKKIQHAADPARP